MSVTEQQRLHLDKTLDAAARFPERGQVLPLLLVVLALAAASALLVSEIAIAALERARAQSAADAAALAGAASGPADAAALAAANGGEVLTYRDLGSTVEVEIGFRRARALATAEAAAAPVTGGDRDGLAPVLLAALARADQLLGRSVPVASGYRSRSEQEALWATRGENPYPVAPPGTSRHESGLAIDVPASFVPTLVRVAATVGLCQPLPQTDPVHFEPCPLIRAA